MGSTTGNKLSESLNQEQKAIYVGIVNDIKQGVNCLLEGYAGVGKTYIAQCFSERFGESALFIAPTNKAVKVLEEKISDSECTTIHKAFGLIVKRGKLEFGSRRKYDATLHEVIFIDECSMIDAEIFKLITENVDKSKTTLVFLGDPAQIMPVETTFGKIAALSPIFTKLSPKYTLTKIVRQAEGNPIIELATLIRTKGFDINDLQKFKGSDGIKVTSGETAINRLPEFIKSGGVYAAYRNADVDEANEYVHNSFYGAESREFVVGEMVVAGAPIFNVHDKNEIIANNGQEFIIEEITEVYDHRLTYNKDNWDFSNGGNPLKDTKLQKPKVWRIQTECGLLIYAKKGSEKPKYEKYLKYLVDSKSWAEYYTFRELISDIRHSYAFTCHKLQGSTYDKIMINTHDILAAPVHEVDKLLYVALTRARKQAVFIL